MVGDREPARDPTRVETDAETFDNDGDLLVHRLEVDAAPAAQRFAPDEHVLGDTEVWEHRCFLVDDGDPHRPRSGGAVQGHLPAVDNEPSALGLVDARQDLDQGRLAGPVLADEAVGLAPVQLDVAVDQRLHSAERLGRMLEDESGSVLSR